MISLQAIALDILEKNPNIANNPRAKEMVDVIRSGDNARGEEIARNLCASYGVSPEQASQDAKRYFGLGN